MRLHRTIFSVHINGKAKAPQIVTHVKWKATNCCERCAWVKASRREIHFNTIVRDLFQSRLFDKIWLQLNYSWMTNKQQQQQQLVSVSGICAICAFKSLHMLVNSISTDWRSRKPAVAAVEVASLMMSMTLKRNQCKTARDQKILSRCSRTFFMTL